MRILMTQRELTHIGGSEMVTVEVAQCLSRRGHEIAVYSPKIGDVAKMLLPSGVRVLKELRDAPWQPDLIHGQHHLPAMAALARFPQTPAIYHCHGTQPWVERPPRHGQIQKYVMMCEWMVSRTCTELGLPAERVTFVPNFVNMTRFSEVRTAPGEIRKALLFGGPPLPKPELDRLVNACKALGITLDKIGGAYGKRKPRPEIFLQKYDLVFAIGRSALEAMATGCAVIPVIPGQAGSLITSATLDEWIFSNCGPRYFMSSSQISENWLRRQIDAYSQSDLQLLTARVRQDCALDGAVDKLETIYREAATANSSAVDGSFAPYLEQLANEVDPMWVEWQGHQGLRTRLAELEAEHRRLQKELLSLYRLTPQKQWPNGEILLERLRTPIVNRGTLQRLKRVIWAG